MKTEQITEAIQNIIVPAKKKPLTYLIMGKPEPVLFNPHQNTYADKIMYQLNPLYWANYTDLVKQQTEQIKLLENNVDIFVHHYEKSHRFEIYVLK